MIPNACKILEFPKMYISLHQKKVWKFLNYEILEIHEFSITLPHNLSQISPAKTHLVGPLRYNSYPASPFSLVISSTPPLFSTLVTASSRPIECPTNAAVVDPVPHANVTPAPNSQVTIRIDCRDSMRQKLTFALLIFTNSAEIAAKASADSILWKESWSRKTIRWSFPSPLWKIYAFCRYFSNKGFSYASRVSSSTAPGEPSLIETCHSFPSPAVTSTSLSPLSVATTNLLSSCLVVQRYAATHLSPFPQVGAKDPLAFMTVILKRSPRSLTIRTPSAPTPNRGRLSQMTAGTI